MRQRISEKNIFPDFIPDKEYLKLWALINDKSAFYDRAYISGSSRMSYRDCLKKLFIKWPLRGTCTSIEEMEYSLGISESQLSGGVTEENLLDYIQFYMNALRFVEFEVVCEPKIQSTNDGLLKAITDQSEMVANHLNADLKDINGELFLVYKDDIAGTVAQMNPDIEPSIIEYQKIDNKHDLTRKAEILCTFYKKIEPLQETFQGTELNSLYRDTTALLQRVARHALDSKDPMDAKFMLMNDDQLEMWTDRSFHMVLACMATVPYIRFKCKIKELKS